MLRLRVLELLDERGKTKYWLYKQLGLGNYDGFNKMIRNRTKLISYANIEALCVIFQCTPNELFEWDFEK